MIYIPLFLYLFIYSVLVTALSLFQVKAGNSQNNIFSNIQSGININDDEDDISNDPFQKSWGKLKMKLLLLLIG